MVVAAGPPVHHHNGLRTWMEAWLAGGPYVGRYRTTASHNYRKPRMISNTQLFFSRRFERISFFCPKNKWVLFLCRISSRHPLPTTTPHQLAPWSPSPTQRLGAVVCALKNRLRRRHALVINNASCAWCYLNVRDRGLVAILWTHFATMDENRDNKQSIFHYQWSILTTIQRAYNEMMYRRRGAVIFGVRGAMYVWLLRRKD